MNYKERFFQGLESDEIASDAIEFILENTESAINAKFIASIEVPVATENAMQKLYKIVAWSMFAHDGNLEISSGALERFSPDGEPCPVSIDPWARGTVQTKKVEQEDNSMFRSTSSAPSTPSVSSFRSSNTGRSRSKHSGSVAGSRMGTSKSAQGAADDDPTGQIWNLDEDSEYDYGNLAATGHMFEMLQKSKRLKQKDPVLEVEKTDEFQILQESIKQAAKDLKGKKYIVDKDGNVLPLTPVNPDALPAYTLALGLNISTKANADDSSSVGSKASSLGSKKKKRPVRVAGSRVVDESLFKPEISLATTLAGGELITNVNAGVALRIDQSMREGPPLPSDPKRMSKKQYMERSMMNSMSQESLGGLHELGAGVSTDSLGDGGNLPMSMMSVTLPDIDALEGGRKVVKAAGSKEAGLDQGLAGASASTLSSIAAVLPGKQNYKQFENVSLLSGGVAKSHPRDRVLPMSQVPPSERRHLPAPALGKTTGHGLSPERVRGGPGMAGVASNGSFSTAGQTQDSSRHSIKGSAGSIKQERKDIARQIF